MDFGKQMCIRDSHIRALQPFLTLNRLAFPQKLSIAVFVKPTESARKCSPVSYTHLLFGGVIVLVRQGFPFQKFFLAGKVLAGQADDDFIGVHINDGIGVFLIQRIDAF